MSGGLVPLKTNATAGGTLFGAGGGGGGGGGGTDIIVSSITINSAGLDGQYFPYNATSTIGIGAGPSGNLIIGNQQGGVNPVLTSGAQINTGEIILSGLTGDFGSQIQARVGADGQGNVQISSLYVSSINGGAPGGGAGPNLLVSSLAVNPSGSLSFPFNGGGAPIIFGSDTADSQKFFYLEAITPAPNGFYQSTTSGLVAMELLYQDNSVDTLAPLVVGSLQIADEPGFAAVQGAFLIENSTIKIKSGFDSYPIAIDAPTTISSLFVSSINNATPGGGGSAPFFSTLNQTPSTINCDANTTQILLSFSTTAGHLYQIQTQMTIQGNGGQEGTANDDVIQEVLNEIYLNTTQGSFISTANAAARDVGIGTCGMWKSNLTGTSLAISGTFSTTVQLGDVYLTDFGPV